MSNNERKNALYSERNDLLIKVSSNDYKNTKNGEAERAGVELPYDPVELYSENQGYRTRINEIDEEIASIPDDEEVEPGEGLE